MNNSNIYRVFAQYNYPVTIERSEFARLQSIEREVSAQAPSDKANPVTHIEMDDGRVLVFDYWPYENGNWRGAGWRLVCGDEHARHLNEYEANFVEAALKAATPPDAQAEIARLTKLCEAISRDCNDCANQQNAANATIAQQAEEIARLKATWTPVCNALTGTDILEIESPVDYVMELFAASKQQAERIKELEASLENANDHSFCSTEAYVITQQQLFAAHALLEQAREALKRLVLKHRDNALFDNGGQWPQAREALALSDLSTSILVRKDAEVLRRAADTCENEDEYSEGSQYCAKRLRRLADETEKGSKPI